jgi:hypothetical protein
MSYGIVFEVMPLRPSLNSAALLESGGDGKQSDARLGARHAAMYRCRFAQIVRIWSWSHLAQDSAQGLILQNP